MRKEDHKTKIYPCVQCKPTEWFTKIQQHWRNAHSSHAVVNSIITQMEIEDDPTTMPEDKIAAYNSRLKLQTTMLYNSMYVNNEKTLRLGKGTLVPVSLPSQASSVSPRDYRTCASCKGLYTKKNLPLHVMRNCKLVDSDAEVNRSQLAASGINSTVLMIPGVSTEVNKMINQMRPHAPVTKVIKKDKLIQYIGYLYMGRKRDIESNSHIRERMRVLAKLVILSGKTELREILLPRNHDIMLEIIQKNMQPSEKLKLGYYLSNAIESLRNIAIKEKTSR